MRLNDPPDLICQNCIAHPLNSIRILSCRSRIPWSTSPPHCSSSHSDTPTTASVVDITMSAIHNACLRREGGRNSLRRNSIAWNSSQQQGMPHSDLSIAFVGKDRSLRRSVGAKGWCDELPGGLDCHCTQIFLSSIYVTSFAGWC